MMKTLLYNKHELKERNLASRGEDDSLLMIFTLMSFINNDDDVSRFHESQFLRAGQRRRVEANMRVSDIDQTHNYCNVTFT